MKSAKLVRQAILGLTVATLLAAALVLFSPVPRAEAQSLCSNDKAGLLIHSNPDCASRSMCDSDHWSNINLTKFNPAKFDPAKFDPAKSDTAKFDVGQKCGQYWQYESLLGEVRMESLRQALVGSSS